MKQNRQAKPEFFVGMWILLFPVTFLAHIAEEYWGGFAAVFAEFTGVAVSDTAFLAANALFWVAMCGAVILVLKQPSRASLIVALATVVTINASLHISAVFIWREYSPGVVTGVLLWLPLGVITLARGHRLVPLDRYRLGVNIGVAAHILVPVVGLSLALALGS